MLVLNSPISRPAGGGPGIIGPLVCHPIETADGKRYQITGQVALGNLFTIDGDPNGN